MAVRDLLFSPVLSSFRRCHPEPSRVPRRMAVRDLLFSPILSISDVVIRNPVAPVANGGEGSAFRCRFVQFQTSLSRTQSSPSANGGEGSAFRCRFVQFLTFVIPNPVAPFANVWRWARVRKDRPSRS